MHSQSKTASPVPAAQHSCNSGVQQRYSPARNKIPIASPNEDNPAQQFRGRHRRIVLGHCVAFRDPQKTVPILLFLDEPMSKKAIVSHDENDVSRNDFIVRYALDRE